MICTNADAKTTLFWLSKGPLKQIRNFVNIFYEENEETRKLAEINRFGRLNQGKWASKHNTNNIII